MGRMNDYNLEIRVTPEKTWEQNRSRVLPLRDFMKAWPGVCKKARTAMAIESLGLSSDSASTTAMMQHMPGTS